MDYIAGILELIGVWLIGSKLRIGFIVCIFGSFAWIASAIIFEMYGLLPTSIIMSIVNVRNFRKWKHGIKKN